MKPNQPKIRPELSALGPHKPICPLLKDLIRAIEEIRHEDRLPVPRIVVEYGCGLLRNLSELRLHFRSICVIDTEQQLRRKHELFGRLLTVSEYIKRRYRDGSVTVMSDRQFGKSAMKSDVIFSINVMDVVLPEDRRDMLANVRARLSATGQFALLVPRNDSRTLQLCKHAHKYRDGHIFPNHGAYTFFKNWRGDELQQLHLRSGFRIRLDISRYRHVCFVCQVRNRHQRLPAG